MPGHWTFIRQSKAIECRRVETILQRARAISDSDLAGAYERANNSATEPF
jgi:hypothetical protein